jgi:hypothetical protein
MYVRSPRSRRPLGSGSRGNWMAWLPLVFLGSMMFWSTALVLGGWSLMVVSDGALEAAGPAPTVTEPMPGIDTQGTGGTFDRIPVQVEESQEPEDVDDNPGAVHTSVPVRDSVIY